MPQVGRIIIGTAGGWSGASYYSYQWEHCDATPASAITGAINTTYEITSADVGHTLCFLVTAFSAPNSSTQAASAPTGLVQLGTPLNRSAPTVSGNPQVGQTLTASRGIWAGSMPISYVYQWRRCDSTGARCGRRFTGPTVSPTYVVQAGDVAHTLVVYVTATNAVGSSSVHAHSTSVVTPGSSASSPNPGTPPPGQAPSASINPLRLHTLLLRVLAARGPGARIGALLKHGGYLFSFMAPSPGRLVIAWFHRVPRGGTIVVATLTIVFHKKGSSKIKLSLTRRGRRLLRTANNITLTVTGRFTPVGQRTTSAKRRMTLTRAAG